MCLRFSVELQLVEHLSYWPNFYWYWLGRVQLITLLSHYPCKIVDLLLCYMYMMWTTQFCDLAVLSYIAWWPLLCTVVVCMQHVALHKVYIIIHFALYQYCRHSLAGRLFRPIHWDSAQSTDMPLSGFPLCFWKYAWSGILNTQNCVYICKNENVDAGKLMVNSLQMAKGHASKKTVSRHKNLKNLRKFKDDELVKKVWGQGRDRMLSRTTSCPTVHNPHMYTHIKIPTCDLD